MTYNMLKVSRNLFSWTKEMAYADYYERALTNGVLSIQRGQQPGVMIYMLPQGPGQSKAVSYHGWGTQFDSFWCCYGTGIESFSKLGDSIYFEEIGSTPGLYIIQFIPSSFNWKSGGIAINQIITPVNSLEPYLQVMLSISANESASQLSTLNVRIPSWTSTKGAKASQNAQDFPLPYPGNFLSITRKWSSNDKLDLQFPLSLRTEAIKDDRPDYASIQAILFGPFLLAGLTDRDWDINSAKSNSISDWIIAIPKSSRSQLISLTQESNNQTFVLSNSNYSLAIEKWPEPGTNPSVLATFRLISQDSNTLTAPPSRRRTIGQYVMLEPFNLPGMVIVHQGPNKSFAVSSSTGSYSTFRVVSGLNGKPNSVSFESADQEGCFICSSGRIVELRCKDHAMAFRNGASFTMIEGLRQYHPISFVAKGVRRNFVLEPLLSLRDETYTVYFNIGA